MWLTFPVIIFVITLAGRREFQLVVLKLTTFVHRQKFTHDIELTGKIRRREKWWKTNPKSETDVYLALFNKHINSSLYFKPMNLWTFEIQDVFAEMQWKIKVNYIIVFVLTSIYKPLLKLPAVEYRFKFIYWLKFRDEKKNFNKMNKHCFTANRRRVVD